MISKLIAEHCIDKYGYMRSYMTKYIKRHLGYFFFITQNCNLNCKYCWQKASQKKELSTEEWINIFKNIPRFSFICFNGGEPLLHPGLKNMIKFLYHRNPCTINTNGSLMTKNFIEHIIKYDVKNISISLDGFPEVHDHFRNKKGLFDQIVKNINCLNELKKLFKKIKPKLTIKTVFTNESLPRIKEFYSFCNEQLKADCLNISLMKTTTHAQFDFCTYNSLQQISRIESPSCFEYDNIEKISETFENLLTFSKKQHCNVVYYPKMKNKYEIEYLLKNNGKNTFRECYFPWSAITILPDGNIIPCLSLKLANIRDLDYDIKKIHTIQNYKNFLNWRKEHNKNHNSDSMCNMCCFSKLKKF